VEAFVVPSKDCNTLTPIKQGLMAQGWKKKRKEDKRSKNLKKNRIFKKNCKNCLCQLPVSRKIAGTN